MTVRSKQLLALTRTTVGNTNSTNFTVSSGHRVIVKGVSVFAGNATGQGALYLRRGSVFSHLWSSPALVAGQSVWAELWQVAEAGDELGFYCLAVGAGGTVHLVASGADLLL